MKRMYILLAILAIIILGVLFYYYVPIMDTPLSGGPISPSNPPKEKEKIPLHDYFYLKDGLRSGTIIE